MQNVAKTREQKNERVRTKEPEGKSQVEVNEMRNL